MSKDLLRQVSAGVQMEDMINAFHAALALTPSVRMSLAERRGLVQRRPVRRYFTGPSLWGLCIICMTQNCSVIKLSLLLLSVNFDVCVLAFIQCRSQLFSLLHRSSLWRKRSLAVRPWTPFPSNFRRRRYRFFLIWPETLRWSYRSSGSFILMCFMPIKPGVSFNRGVKGQSYQAAALWTSPQAFSPPPALPTSSSCTERADGSGGAGWRRRLERQIQQFFCLISPVPRFNFLCPFFLSEWHSCLRRGGLWWADGDGSRGGEAWSEAWGRT